MKAPGGGFGQGTSAKAPWLGHPGRTRPSGRHLVKSALGTGSARAPWPGRLQPNPPPVGAFCQKAPPGEVLLPKRPGGGLGRAPLWCPENREVSRHGRSRTEPNTGTQAPDIYPHTSSLDTDLTRNIRAPHFTPQHWLLCHMGLYYFLVVRVHTPPSLSLVDGAVDCPVEVPAWFMGLCGFLGDLPYWMPRGAVIGVKRAGCDWAPCFSRRLNEM